MALSADHQGLDHKDPAEAGLAGQSSHRRTVAHSLDRSNHHIPDRSHPGTGRTGGRIVVVPAQECTGAGVAAVVLLAR